MLGSVIVGILIAICIVICLWLGFLVLLYHDFLRWYLSEHNYPLPTKDEVSRGVDAIFHKLFGRE